MQLECKYNIIKYYIKLLYITNTDNIIYFNGTYFIFIKDDFYSKIPTKNFFYFLPICSLKYA